MIKLLILLCAMGCTKAQAPAKDSARIGHVLQYENAIQRLFENHVYNGFVVSKRAGKPYVVGEGVLFSGIAMAHMPCGKASMILDGILKSI